MDSANKEPISRRDFIRLATGALAATGVGVAGLTSARADDAAPKTLTILQWRHFVPDYDDWFDNELVKNWGEKNNTKVVVDRVGLDEIDAQARAEIAAGSGHDLILFPFPPAVYERHAVDHADVYQAVGHKYGRVSLLGYASTYNPSTRKYFAFTDSFIPAPLLFNGDYWNKINVPFGPATYADLLEGAKDIRDKFDVPCGLTLAPGLTSNITLLAILSTFGANIQDSAGHVTIDADKRAVFALDYVKNLYSLAGSPNMLTQGGTQNADALMALKTSCTINSVSPVRNAEKSAPDLARRFRLTPALRTPHRQVTYPQVTNCYVIWDFAKNKDGAKLFLTNLLDNARAGFHASAFCNFPSFTNAVPDLAKQLSNDPSADPPYKYAQLQDTLHWTQNLGYPGYATAGFMETFNANVIPGICAQVATGKLTPDAGATALAAAVKECYARWT